MLSFKLMKKIQGENKDIFPTPTQGKAAKKKQKQLEGSQEAALTAEKQTSASSEKKSDSKIRGSSQERSLESTPKVTTANKLSLGE